MLQWSATLEQVLGGGDVPLRPSEIRRLQQQPASDSDTADSAPGTPPLSGVPGSILPQPQDGGFFRLKPRLQSTLDQNGEESGAAQASPQPPSPRRLFSLQGVTTSSIDDEDDEEERPAR